jgi:cold shock CspA family protein/ribosome-associated translation inhibitor RaiA
MEIPLRIAFRDMEPSPTIESQIRRRADELEQFHHRITACHVVVEAHHRHHHKGRLYHVAIRLVVPEGEVVVKRDPAEHHAHEDIHVAIRDAFDAARRQLQNHVRYRRGDVKQHEIPPHGVVARLFPEEGYGFLRSADGQEIYFHRNSVADDGFDALEVGEEVRFALHEGEGEKGAQASTVVRLGKHHLSPTPP